MEVRVLGPIEVVGWSGAVITVPGTKMRGLVALLALHVGSSVPPQRVIEALWGEQDIRLNSMQVLVSKLRRLLADDTDVDPVITHPAGYELRLDRDAVDALRFEALIALADGMSDDPSERAGVLRGALAIWRGAPLADAPSTDLFRSLQARLEEMRRDAVEDLVDAELLLGLHRRLAPELEALVAAEPYRERRWGQLIRALYASGRQADALRAFQRARSTLIEIGVEPGAELRQLEEAVLAQDETVLVAPRTPAGAAPIGEGFRRRGNVRHPIDACIGRTNDLATLVDLVTRHRLVTLIGPGGVGKTRLALELAVALTDTTPDGVWWVELAAARTEADVVASLLRSLGMDAAAATDREAALDTIAVTLSAKELVVVIDNCEHLVDVVAVLTEELLGRCGELRIVTTSRERLGIPAERLFDVDPLVLAAAIELFEARAAGALDGALGSTDAVAAICARLDRLPLALELAAARARQLRPEEILERLEGRADFLPDGSRTAQEHQRSLRAVADWSYELLDAAERAAFERLSVFTDGATLEGAQRVCAGRDASADDVERLLHRLVDKSLIVADRSGPVTRYRMLQTLADYAAEQLDAHGDLSAARHAHALWVLALAGTVQFGARTTGATVATVQDEDAAIRDAVAWSVGADPALALEICAKLSPFWFGTMRVPVGWELLSNALEAASSDEPLKRSDALVWAVVFATMVQDIDTAQRLAEEALAFERGLGDPARLGVLHFALALAAGYHSDSEADRWVDEGRRHFTAADLRVGLGHLSLAEGAARLVEGDIDAAATSLFDAIATFRDEHDHLGLILGVSRLGELAWRRNDIELFAEMHAELLELGRAGRSSAVIAGATARLALASLERGDVDEAQQLARAALVSSGDTFMPVVNGYVFKSAGLVNLRSGHTAEGQLQLRAAIEAFGQGTGSLGEGLAAMCWVDLSRSYAETGAADDARRSAATAVDVALGTGDPWIRAQAEAHLALLDRPATAPAGPAGRRTSP